MASAAKSQAKPQGDDGGIHREEFLTLAAAVNRAVDISAEAGEIEVSIVREDIPRGRCYWCDWSEHVGPEWDDAVVLTLTAPMGPRRWNS